MSEIYCNECGGLQNDCDCDIEADLLPHSVADCELDDCPECDEYWRDEMADIPTRGDDE